MIGKLAPGEKVTIPLRINFVTAQGLKTLFAGPVEKARAFYTGIERLPAGSIITEVVAAGAEPPKNLLRKRKESYLPPERPGMGTYVYGTEITMNGLMVDGARVLLQETSTNFLELTAGEGYGSCPYLYAFDATSRRWINYGKVIHEADAPSKELTEEVRLERLSTRFQIAEEELEVSQLDQVSLVLDLKKGQTMRLDPGQPALIAADKRYLEVAAGKAVEIAFQLPPGIRDVDVAQARLIVTGYYTRYASMKISRYPLD